MSLSPILAGVGIAAGAVVTGATKAISSGLAFASELAKAPESKDSSAVTRQPTPEEARDAVLKQLRERLQDRLKAAGIDLSRPIVLEANPTGTLRVTNDHPQWRAIEQTLGEDESFASQFAQLQSAVVATGQDSHHAKNMSVELASEQLRIILPR